MQVLHFKPMKESTPTDSLSNHLLEHIAKYIIVFDLGTNLLWEVKVLEERVGFTGEELVNTRDSPLSLSSGASGLEGIQVVEGLVAKGAQKVFSLLRLGLVQLQWKLADLLVKGDTLNDGGLLLRAGILNPRHDPEVGLLLRI